MPKSRPRTLRQHAHDEWQLFDSVLVSMSQSLIRCYQKCISPFLGPRCRFFPSCSEYAFHALRGHGFLKGGVLACRRLCRCHPWHPGGIDPVPLEKEKDW